jgi:hypothetical protein
MYNEQIHLVAKYTCIDSSTVTQTVNDKHVLIVTKYVAALNSILYVWCVCMKLYTYKMHAYNIICTYSRYIYK